MVSQLISPGILPCDPSPVSLGVPFSLTTFPCSWQSFVLGHLFPEEAFQGSGQEKSLNLQNPSPKEIFSCSLLLVSHVVFI